MMTFRKAATWQCAKCNATLGLQYGMDATELEVFELLVKQHQKASIDCSAPAGFRLVNLFVKHEDDKGI